MKENKLSIIRLISNIVILITSLLAMVLPYSLELFLGLSMIGLCGNIIYYVLCFKDKAKWESLFTIILSIISIILVLVLLITKILYLYYPIVIINLVLVSLYFALTFILINKNNVRNKVLKNTLLGFGSIIILLIAVLSIVSHVGYQRTMFSSVVEVFLKSSNSGAFDSVEAADSYMEKRALVNDNEYTLPKMSYQTDVNIDNMFSHQVITYEGSKNNNGYIIYVHGGAYVNETSNYHVMFCDHLAKKTGYKVYAPIYPLAPNHTYEETYDLIEKIYLKLMDDNLPIIIMGDSAGGGFTAAFTEYLSVKGLKLPDKIVLLSPWVDVSMSNTEYDDYYDPMLGVIGLKEMGEKWKGDLELNDYQISPLFGDVSNMPKTLMFVGTREIFNPDVRLFYDKLVSNNIDVTLEIGEGMNHVYPIYPIFEARIALNEIAEFILS